MTANSAQQSGPVHMIEWLADRYGFDLLGCSTTQDQRNAIRYMKRVHRERHPSEFDRDEKMTLGNI